ncbi:MAG TPA: hypothetical protein VL651_08160 [Bacteroidia bacterium]|jgi:WD40 repeat protein|nr:hypothetical protein [Bacteroidia bacterium]
MKKIFALIAFLFITSFVHAQTYVQNESVEILWPQDGQWYAGKILKVQGDKYMVSYDGYGAEWNEVVGKDRLKKVAAETTSNGQEQTNTSTTTTTTAPVNESANAFYASVETIWDIQLDKSGKLLVCASAYGNIKILNEGDLTLVQQIEVGKDPISCVSISDDGMYVAAGGEQLYIYKKNSSTGLYESYDTPTGYTGLAKMRFIPGTHDLIVGGAPKSDYTKSIVDVWSVDEKKVARNILPATGSNFVCAMAVSSDGKNVALTFSTVKHGVDIYDVATGKLTAHLVSKMDISAVAFSPDGNFVVGGGLEQKAFVWNVSTKALVCTALWRTSDQAYIYGVAFSPDGKSIAVCGMGSGSAVNVYDATKGTLQRGLGTDNPNGNAITYNKEGTAVLTAFTTYGDIAKVTVVEKFSAQ